VSCAAVAAGGVVFERAIAAGARKVRYYGEALSDEDVARLRALGYAVPERKVH
jgi:hypothetical protein